MTPPKAHEIETLCWTWGAVFDKILANIHIRHCSEKEDKRGNCLRHEHLDIYILN